MRTPAIILIPILLILYMGIALVIVSVGYASVTMPDIDAVSILSLILFVLLAPLGLTNERVYLTILVFMIVGFPSAVNNFVPGVYMGEPTELGASIFPFFTHLDVYLLMGIIRYSRNRFNQDYIKIAPVIAAIVALMFLSFIFNALSSKTLYEAALLVMGSFQFRYLVLIYFVLVLLKEQRLKFIAAGFVLSIFFLLAESVVFTYMNDLDRLSAGSIGTNTFGNIVAQLSVFLFFFSRNYAKFSGTRIILVGTSLTGLLIALLSGTRMSIISVVIVYAIAYVYRKFTFTHFLRIAVLAIVVVVAIFQFQLYENLPPKYKVWEFVNPTMVRTIMAEDQALRTKVPITPESSSIITRVQLYRTSFRMIEEDPIWGIGAGKWNYVKPRFGFDQPILIDSHNGYLALLSQYGIPGGIVIIFFLFVVPALLFLKNIGKYEHISDSGVWVLGIVSFGMAICELSNAGIFKPQVFAILSMIAMMLLAQNKKEKHEAES